MLTERGFPIAVVWLCAAPLRRVASWAVTFVACLVPRTLARSAARSRSSRAASWKERWSAPVAAICCMRVLARLHHCFCPPALSAARRTSPVIVGRCLSVRHCCNQPLLCVSQQAAPSQLPLSPYFLLGPLSALLPGPLHPPKGVFLCLSRGTTRAVPMLHTSAPLLRRSAVLTPA